MNLELYPKFEDVFADQALKGIFYPLCSAVFQEFPGKSFHFVSSNGLWMDENYQTEYNTFNYTLFDFQNNQYQFKGDIRLYRGYDLAKSIIGKLEHDFDQNGPTYLEKKIQTNDYIAQQKQILDIPLDDGFDMDHYLQTFYEFSINRLNFQMTGEFGQFQHLIDGWGKADKSPVVHTIKNDHSSGFADIEVNKEYLFPDTITIDDYSKIGFVVGHEFFTDGNDHYLLYDPKNERLINIHHYS